MTWCTSKEWELHEDAMILHGRSQRPPMTFGEIAVRLGRTRGAVEARLSRLQRTPGRTVNHVIAQGRVIPETVLAEKRCRQEIRNNLSDAALLMGDPLPGYSALDARMRATATATSSVTLASTLTFKSTG